ncbi:MAG: hypothetical protein MUO26_00815 [Methanotrichaceae archaeon]|nr:hypothetical protein [Methanotrichaceae archaeon]
MRCGFEYYDTKAPCTITAMLGHRDSPRTNCQDTAEDDGSDQIGGVLKDRCS